MTVKRNKDTKRIIGIDSEKATKIQKLFQMSPLDRASKQQNLTGLVYYVIYGIKDGETVAFRKFFSDESGAPLLYRKLDDQFQQLKNNPTKEQTEIIKKYIDDEETKRFLELLTKYSSTNAHPLPWVNKFKEVILKIQNLIYPPPIQLVEKSVDKHDFTKKDPIDSKKSHAIWDELNKLGILNPNETVSDILNPSTKLTLSNRNNTHTPHVLIILNRLKEKNEVVSAEAFIKKSDLNSSQYEKIGEN